MRDVPITGIYPKQCGIGPPILNPRTHSERESSSDMAGWLQRVRWARPLVTALPQQATHLSTSEVLPVEHASVHPSTMLTSRAKFNRELVRGFMLAETLVLGDSGFRFLGFPTICTRFYASTRYKTPSNLHARLRKR